MLRTWGANLHGTSGSVYSRSSKKDVGAGVRTGRGLGMPVFDADIRRTSYQQCRRCRTSPVDNNRKSSR